MYEGLGLSKYLAISMAGHALAIVGISYGVAAYAPARLIASNEIFSISISNDIGEGSSAKVQPMTMSEEAPAQTLLPSTPINTPIKEPSPARVKKTIPRDNSSNELVQARYNPAKVDSSAQSANESQGDNSGHSTSGRAGGGSVGGVATIYAPKPPYPWAARVAGFEGRVVLELNISEHGRVNDARIVESSGREDCDTSALKTVKERWNFEPAKINGVPVDCTEKVSVRYVLR